MWRNAELGPPCVQMALGEGREELSESPWDRNKSEIIEKYLNVPPFVSSSSPSWASAEHLDPLDDDVVSLTPSLAKFPICRMNVKGQKVKRVPGDSRNFSADPP